VAALLPPGLNRSAFFSALGLHSGLPVRELEAALKSKVTAPAPPSPATAAGPVAPGRTAQAPRPPAPAERPPPNLEACYVAFLLESPGLKERDPWQGADDLRHPGLRALLARLGAGAPKEEALFEATPLVKAALDREGRHVPTAEVDRERAFLRVCQKLAVGRIDERLADIAREAAQVVGANELTEDLRRLQAERVELLELKKQVSAAKT
jgi:hypothetical protein